LSEHTSLLVQPPHVSISHKALILQSNALPSPLLNVLIPQIMLYQALTGRLCWVLGTHEGMVYSISWSRDDSCVITASADYTAKVWHLPLLPSPANANAAQIDPTAGTASDGRSTLGTAAAAAAAAAAADGSGVSCSVLQHKCFVYAAELHPVQQPLLLAVTGGYDGVVRVWSAVDGQQLSCLQVRLFCACTTRRVACITAEL
jgi:WD40 repeat protein